MREGDKVNVFDRAVAAVAPVHAAKRAAARAALKVIDSGYGNYGAIDPSQNAKRKGATHE